MWERTATDSRRVVARTRLSMSAARSVLAEVADGLFAELDFTMEDRPGGPTSLDELRDDFQLLYNTWFIFEGIRRLISLYS